MPFTFHGWHSRKTLGLKVVFRDYRNGVAHETPPLIVRELTLGRIAFVVQ
jgi:hypothetical protein